MNLPSKYLLGVFIILTGLGCSTNIKSTAAPTPIVQENPKVFCGISFFSIGYGIDVQGLKAVDNWVKSKGDSLQSVKQPWGREGEVDFCLSSHQAEPRTKVWIQELRTLLADFKNCRISGENACRSRK
jgi:hypothetical protein